MSLTALAHSYIGGFEKNQVYNYYDYCSVWLWKEGQFGNFFGLFEISRFMKSGFQHTHSQNYVVAQLSAMHNFITLCIFAT